MSANTWFYIAIFGFTVAGLFVVISVILFFRLHIGSVLYELSGKGVAREVELIRKSSASGEDLATGASHTTGDLVKKNSKKRGTMMGIVHESKRLDTPEKSTGEYTPTVLLNASAVQKTENGTVVLSNNTQQSNPTTLLTENQADVITEELRPQAAAGETAQLNGVENGAVAFSVVREDMVIHTDEEI